jgi:hypothetical protein
MAKPTEENFIVALYDDEEKLLHAVEQVQKKGVTIADIFTPFPVHGIEKLLGYKESRLPDAAFIFGVTGTTLALLMQIWMYAFDWPVNVGGKPNLPLPSFIPITFELTVLFCSLGMVGTYMFANRLAPGIQPVIVDPRQTDDLFVLTVKAEDDTSANQAIKDKLNQTHPVEVREQAYVPQFLNVNPS